jgi:hypothetical protein
MNSKINGLKSDINDLYKKINDSCALEKNEIEKRHNEIYAFNQIINKFSEPYYKMIYDLEKLLHTLENKKKIINQVSDLKKQMERLVLMNNIQNIEYLFDGHRFNIYYYNNESNGSYPNPGRENDMYWNWSFEEEHIKGPNDIEFNFYDAYELSKQIEHDPTSLSKLREMFDIFIGEY